MAVLTMFANVPHQINTPVGLIELDIDINAERVILVDRSNFETIYVDFANPTMSIIVPTSYTIDHDVVCIIMDDDREYSAAIVDGIKATVVNLSEI